MVLPVWDDSIDSEENYIRTKLPLQTWAERSGASIFQELKDLGFSIGEDKFYSIRRDVLEIVRHQEQIASLNPDTLIPIGYMNRQPTWNLKEDYIYHIRYQYTIGDSNEIHEGGYSVTANQRFSKQDVEDLALDDLEELKYERDGKQITIQSASLLGVTTRRTTA